MKTINNSPADNDVAKNDNPNALISDNDLLKFFNLERENVQDFSITRRKDPAYFPPHVETSRLNYFDSMVHIHDYNSPFMVMSSKLLNKPMKEGGKVKKLEYLGRRNICGERVRKERVTRRISQERLAAKMQMRGVEIEQDAISRIESGDRLVTDYELRAFTALFEVPIESLLEPEDA